MNSIRPWLRIAMSPPILRRALATAGVVGVLLTLVNHGDQVVHGRLGPDHVWPIAFTFIVPFVVATISSAAVVSRPGARVAAALPPEHDIEALGTVPDPDANSSPVLRLGARIITPSGLLLLSAAAFGATGLGYLLVPGSMLSVVGIESVATHEFLRRTEGVALLSAAAFLWAARDGSPSQVRVVLFTLSAYYVLGSLVDLVAFAQGIVGTASVPSAAIRIVVGGVCLVAAVRVSRRPATT